MRKISYFRSFSGTLVLPIGRVIRIPSFILILLSLTSLSLYAQDLIKFKSGKELKVSIIEEGTDIIKYREFENPTGPVYSVGRDKVDSIKYKKGNKELLDAKTKEEEKRKADSLVTSLQSIGNHQLTAKKRSIYLDGIEQSPRNVKTIMEDHPEALKYYESGRKMVKASNSCAVGLLVTSIIAVIISDRTENESNNRTVGYVMLGIDGGFIIGGIALASIGKKNIKKSVTLYNSPVNKPVTYNLNVGLQDNGIGFSLKF
jgi:hypothetical protein